MKGGRAMKRLLTTGIGSILMLVLVMNTSLAGAVTGGVTASGTNNAKITISIADATADFGTNLDPAGTASDSGDTVADVQGSSGDQGSYYVWKSGGMDVTVKSNKVWNGTLAATENGGTSSSITIASGALRYAESTEPSSYTDCSSSTAFATTSSSWKSAVSAGVSPYTHYYCLRVDWVDDPGTFVSTLTYAVTQS